MRWGGGGKTVGNTANHIPRRTTHVEGADDADGDDLLVERVEGDLEDSEERGLAGGDLADERAEGNEHGGRGEGTLEQRIDVQLDLGPRSALDNV